MVYANLAAIVDAGVSFVAPASKIYVSAAVLAKRDRQAAVAVDYVAERDQGKVAEARGSYRVIEDTMLLTGKRKADPDLALRRVFVWSSARACAAHARDQKLDRARGDLERLGRGPGGDYPDVAAVEARVAVIARERKVTSYPRVHIGTDGRTSPPWSGPSTPLPSLPRRPATAGMRC